MDNGPESLLLHMQFLLRLIISTLAVVIVGYLLPGVRLDSAWSAIMVAVLLSLLNGFVKPILVFLTIPITFFTFGLFLLAINAFMIMIVSRLVPGFHVSGFWAALWFSICLSLVTSMLEALAREKKDPS